MYKELQISDSEWIIMQILWDNPPHTSGQIMQQLPEEIKWKPTTVKTLLSRLVNKEVVYCEKSSRIYKYSPLVTREECVRAENKSFINKIYGGAIKPLIVNLLEDEELTMDEIKELRDLLEKKGKHN